MAGAASQAGDADSSRAPGLTSGLQGSVNGDSASVLLYFTLTTSIYVPFPGCPVGFYGHGCKSKCNPGFYGDQCRQRCGCTSHQTCDPIKGCLGIFILLDYRVNLSVCFVSTDLKNIALISKIKITI